MQKLFPLGRWGAVATSGAAVGIAVSRKLSVSISRQATLLLSELEEYVLAVLRKEYEGFLARGAKWFSEHPDAHQLSYLLLAGRKGDEQFGFAFYASESHGERHHRLATGSLLTAPRRLGLEMRLARAAQAGASEQKILETAAIGLRQIAARETAVDGPFDVALIDTDGLRMTRVETPNAP